MLHFLTDVDEGAIAFDGFGRDRDGGPFGAPGGVVGSMLRVSATASRPVSSGSEAILLKRTGGLAVKFALHEVSLADWALSIELLVMGSGLTL